MCVPNFTSDCNTSCVGKVLCVHVTMGLLAGLVNVNHIIFLLNVTILDMKKMILNIKLMM